MTFTPGGTIQRVIDLGVCKRCGEVHEKCKAHVRSGRPCRRVAMADQYVCDLHGGKSPWALAKVEERRARQMAMDQAGELIAEAMAEVEQLSGIDQLRTAINHAGAMSLAFRWLLDELPTRSRWSWEEVDGAGGSRHRWVTVQEAGLVGPDAQGVLRMHPYEEGFRRWTELHARLLKSAADIGLDERRQRFAEDQVRAIGALVRHLVNGLGRDLDDPEVVPVVEAALALVAETAK
jgi:hypothetical protein